MVFSFGNGIEPAFEHPTVRQYFDRLGRTSTVVAVDRRGFGSSEREVSDLSLEAQIADVEAAVNAIGAEEVDLCCFLDAIAPCVALAAGRPELVRSLILWDAFIDGPSMGPESSTKALIELIRGNWTLATRAMGDIAFPGGPVENQRWFARQFRESISAEVAARYLELALSIDLRPYLPSLQVPTLVIQRRGDRTIPFGAARELAAAIPGARFLALDGDMSYSMFGDLSYLADVEAFLAANRGRAPALETSTSDLSPREVEVLRLLAQGKTNKDIADALVISLNTVSHHVTNILNKAGLSNRTEAAAYAHRHGLA
jgi:DNA-binding CsgD family transcriptional regulator/pimeloyl-ACP methyl ester carboxylesterase